MPGTMPPGGLHAAPQGVRGADAVAGSTRAAAPCPRDDAPSVRPKLIRMVLLSQRPCSCSGAQSSSRSSEKGSG